MLIVFLFLRWFNTIFLKFVFYTFVDVLLLNSKKEACPYLFIDLACFRIQVSIAWGCWFSYFSRAARQSRWSSLLWNSLNLCYMDHVGLLTRKPSVWRETNDLIISLKNLKNQRCLVRMDLCFTGGEIFLTHLLWKMALLSQIAMLSHTIKNF